MMPLAASCHSADPMQSLLGELDCLGATIIGEAVVDILARSGLGIDEVAPFVTPQADTYSRRLVARTATYEVLIMTWLPGQGSAAHDHLGAVSAFKILRGTAHETRFSSVGDGVVEGTRELNEGDVQLDEAEVIHAVRNDRSSTVSLVSLHVYAPPMPEPPVGIRYADNIAR